MKHNPLLSLALLIFFICIIAPTAGAQPALRWLETVHDFGAFAENSGAATCTFRFVNDGPGAASIVSARATCGCTQPRYTVSSIAPGDTASVTVSFDPAGRPGRFSKYVYVETSGQPRKQRLEVKGVVIGDAATVEHRYPADFGRLKLAAGGIMMGEAVKGSLKTAYTEGYNRSADSLRIEVTAKPQWLDIIPSPNPVGPGEQITLVSYLNSQTCPLYGLVEDSVTIAAGPGETFTLPVTAIVNEDFSSMSASDKASAPIAVTSTDILDFGTLSRTATPATLTFTLTNAGRDRLAVRRIYSADPGVKVSYDGPEKIGHRKSGTVTVTLDPALAAGPAPYISARLQIITNDYLNPVRAVRIAATVN